MIAVPSVTMAKVTKGKAKTEKWADNADRRKADYIFMEAMRQNALDNNDAFFELLNAANELDSTETAPGLTLGYYYMALGQQEDTLLAAKGYNLMKRHFDRNPGDYYNSVFFGMVNNQLGNNRESVRVWSTLDSLYPDKPDVALKLAEALQNARDTASLRKSITVLSRIERAEGKDLGLTSHKIRAYLALHDTLPALAEIDTLLASSPRSSEYNIYAGDIRMALRQPDKALEYYNRACQLDSTNGLAYYKLAEYYRSINDSVAFDREVFHALSRESLELPVKLEMLRNYIGQLYTDTLQRPRIESLFDDLLRQHPHEPDIRDLYASYLVAINDYKGAAEQQEYALDGDLSNEDRWRTVISLYYQAGETEKSIETGERALGYMPESANINLMMGANYQQEGESQKAMTHFRKAYDLIPDDNAEMRSQLLASIGDEFYRLNERDSAFVYYERATELDPGNLLALNNFAYYLAEEGRDLDRAEKMSAICVRANPDNDTALDTYAWIYYKKRDYLQAKDLIDRALAIEGDDAQADVLDHAGDIYYMNHLTDEAVDFWERALELDPDNALIQKKVKNRTHFHE